MTETATKSYPNVAQSFGISGIVILAMLLLSPVHFMTRQVIGKEGSMLIYYLLAMGVSFFIIHLIRKRKTGSSAFFFRVNPGIIPFISLGTLGLLFGIITPLGLLLPMPDSIKKMFMELIQQTGPMSFFTMVVAAPIFEELIFRGIILDGLLKKYTPLKSILISALLFGLVHLNPWQFITGFILGIFSGWVYYHTRSLLACIIIHATANLTGFFLRFIVSDTESLLYNNPNSTYGGYTNFLFVTGGCAALALVCIWFLNKEFMKRSRIEQA